MKFSFCFSCVFIFVIFTSILTVNAAKKKCSRTISRIPVHKKFDLKKFVGTWYTIQRTTWVWGDDTYHSFSIEITKHEKNTFHYAYTGQVGDTCLPVESGTLELRSRSGEYFLRGSGSKDSHATMIISFTDYKDMAVMYYCFNYRPGSQNQCAKDGMQVEIVSRSLKPSKSDLHGYIKRANKRLCASDKQLEPTSPGECKIPEILEAARLGNKKKKDEVSSDVQNNKCAVDNIPVQKDFNSSQLHGLWYEIARTRFTFNKMESVVNFHRYDESNGKIYSYYTGTAVTPSSQDEPVPCQPPIHGMSIVKEDSTTASDRLGRIGWEDSTYPWSPLKVLYADDDHILFYSCFSGSSSHECITNMTEVTLSGRTRDISEEKLQSFYNILTELCIDPNDLIETKFYANCSAWVSIETESVEPSDCLLDDINTFVELDVDYDKFQMAGDWFQYQYISYNNVTTLHGVVLSNKIYGDFEIIKTTLTAFSETGSCITYKSISRDTCIDSTDFITTLPSGGDGNFVFKKVLYLDNDTYIEYVCSKLTFDHKCELSGIHFNIYIRDILPTEETVNEQTLDIINKVTKSACLDSKNLVRVTEWCIDDDTVSGNIDDIQEVTSSQEVKSQAVVNGDDSDDNNDDDDSGSDDTDDDSDNNGNDDDDNDDNDDDEDDDDECDIDKITTIADIDDYYQEKVYGYWYEIARSTGNNIMSEGLNVVAYFTSPSNETLSIYYTGISSDSDMTICTDIQHTSLLARCPTDYSGDYLIKYQQTQNFVSYAPYKILYTDFTSLLVTYSCQQMTLTGSCQSDSAHIRIWSRNSTLDEDSLSYAYSICHWACISDPDREGFFQTFNTETNPCLSKLEDYIDENVYIVTPDIDEYKDDDDDDYSEPNDQGQLDEFQNDLEDALSMDDEEFYSDWDWFR